MSVRSRIAIIARNSVFGRAAILKFRRLDADLVVVAGSENGAERALALGAREAVVADARRVDELAAVLSGVHTLLYDPGLRTQPEEDVPASLIEAATLSAVSHVIFLSCLRPLSDDSHGFRLRLDFEKALANSGLRYSILQSAMFMQNIGFLLVELQRSRTLLWPWNPSRRFAMVDVMDVAEAAAKLVTNPRLAGGTYELCAEEITPDAISDILSSVLGYRITPKRMSFQDGEFDSSEIDVSPGWTPDMLRVPHSRFDDFGYTGGNSFTLSRILERNPTYTDAFLRDICRNFLTVYEDKKLTTEALVDAMFLSLMSSEL